MGKPPSALNIQTDDQGVLPVLITKFWSAVVHSKLSGHVADITGKIARVLMLLLRPGDILTESHCLDYTTLFVYSYWCAIILQPCT